MRRFDIGFAIGAFAVSIHAPVKGATSNGYSEQVTYQGFNPRTREGCDLIIIFTNPQSTSFNPRTREGCDQA